MQKILFAVFFCGITTTSFCQFPWIWGLLARGEVRSLATYGVDRYVLRKAGLKWYERQGVRFLINKALEQKGYQAISNPADCLVLEFDGKINKVGNYCNYPIRISGFAQYIDATGEIVISSCNECYINSMQFLNFQSPQGPFVAVYYDNSKGAYDQYQTPQSNNGDGIWTKLISRSKNRAGASVVFELHNSTKSAVGFVITTRSIWAHANIKVFNKCGGVYGQYNSPYDTFSGISKKFESPTWIAPGKKIIVSAHPNTLQGDNCDLSHAIVETYVFNIGSEEPESMPIIVNIKE